MALADIEQLVKDMVADQDANVTPDVLTRAIGQALQQYSADCPREVIQSVTWPRGAFADVPANWVPGTTILRAVWVLGAGLTAGMQRPVFVAAFRKDADTWALEANQLLPEGAVVQLTLAGTHVLSDTEDSIPAAHHYPVAAWTASLLCRQLATRFSAERETAIGADMAQTESRARAYAARAKEWRAAYFSALGLIDPEQRKDAPGGAASASVSWPKRNPRHSLVVRP